MPSIAGFVETGDQAYKALHLAAICKIFWHGLGSVHAVTSQSGAIYSGQSGKITLLLLTMPAIPPGAQPLISVFSPFSKD